MIRVAVILGTRPEAIKLAPVIRELKKHPGLIPVVIHTGQHEHLGSEIFSLFDIEPDHRLHTMVAGQSPFSLLEELLHELSELLPVVDPDWAVVQGDTATTLASAQTASFANIPVAHVEAGLRSFDKQHPFPEEIFRTQVSQIADIHFAPTEQAKQNLLKEGISEAAIHVTGNTVVDALYFMLDLNRADHNWRDQIKLSAEDYLVLLTSHRRENFGTPQKRIFETLRSLTDHHPGLHFIYPVHPNPKIQASLEILKNHDRIHLIEPLDYIEFLQLMQQSDLVISDSGGIQEEAPALGKPVIVLREKTERPELIEAGAGVLVGSDPAKIEEAVENWLKGNFKIEANSIFGDGTSSVKIAELLIQHSSGLK